MRIQYVVGFLFSEDKEKVVLIEKNRPAFQAGKYNGVGGKIEEGETALQAMQREFWEETGVTIDSWKQYSILTGDCIVYVFKAFSEKYLDVKSITDEKVSIHYSFKIPELNVMPNLKWLVPMATDVDHVHCVAEFS